jgi:hypothetical protein
MKESDFVGYVGSANLHDSHVRSVSHAGSDVEVRLSTQDGREFTVRFSGVRNVSANEPEGMMIYALVELSAHPPGRRFVFANWDEEDHRTLEIVAADFKIDLLRA